MRQETNSAMSTPFAIWESLAVPDETRHCGVRVTVAPAAPDARGLAAEVPRLDDVTVHRVLDAPDALLDFVDAGVLGPADVHVAATLARLCGDERDEVLLAAALAVAALVDERDPDALGQVRRLTQALGDGGE